MSCTVTSTFSGQAYVRFLNRASLGMMGSVCPSLPTWVGYETVTWPNVIRFSSMVLSVASSPGRYCLLGMMVISPFCLTISCALSGKRGWGGSASATHVGKRLKRSQSVDW
jgi:hypothetical protein